jgi:hypothetical protein
MTAARIVSAAGAAGITRLGTLLLALGADTLRLAWLADGLRA